MNTHTNDAIASLKNIIDTAQNCVDALYADQFKYKDSENSMNYIRLCSQKVQLHMKNYENEQTTNN
jgi:hypothetical protein